MTRFKYGMLSPLLALFVAVVGFPLFYALYLSATDYKLTDRRAPPVRRTDELRQHPHQPPRFLAGIRNHRHLRPGGGGTRTGHRPGAGDGAAAPEVGSGCHPRDAAGAHVHHAGRRRSDVPVPAQRPTRCHPVRAQEVRCGHRFPGLGSCALHVGPHRRLAVDSVHGVALAGRPGIDPPNSRWRRPASTARRPGMCSGGSSCRCCGPCWPSRCCCGRSMR